MNKHNLTEENYFSKENNIKYSGSSQIKSFIECEAKAMAEINGGYIFETTSSMLVGSYIDAHFSKTLDLFKAQHSEIFKKDGTLLATYKNADDIIQYAENDPMIMKYLSGDTQTIMTGKIESVPIKIKIDSYHKDKVIVDLKVVKDFEPIWNNDLKEKQNFIDFWKYTMQGALYQEIVFQNTGKKLPFYIVALTKEKQPDKAILSIPQDVLDEQLEYIKSILPRIKEVKIDGVEPIKCGKCDYCKSIKKIDKVLDYRELGE